MDKSQTSKGVMPVLYSVPTINRLDLPSRAELLPRIENGEVDHMDFRAHVYSPKTYNFNPSRFRVEDMPAFARSFEGQPYLRDHNTWSIDGRDGTLIAAEYVDDWITVDVRLTTRRGMIDYIEGKMDRFSIGWHYDDAICSICEESYFSRDCPHWPGMKYKVGSEERMCILTFTNPRGKEVSAVNTPAVQGTGITGALAEYKLSLIDDVVFETAPSNPVVIEASTASVLTDDMKREAQILSDRVATILRKENHNNA